MRRDLWDGCVEETNRGGCDVSDESAPFTDNIGGVAKHARTTRSGRSHGQSECAACKPQNSHRRERAAHKMHTNHDSFGLLMDENPSTCSGEAVLLGILLTKASGLLPVALSCRTSLSQQW